mgnify:FL=1
MDRFEGTSNIIKAYYQFKRNGNNAEFVSKVCEYFNCIKSDKLDGSDLNFLSFIASEAGVPQYYDMLIKRQNRDEMDMVEQISLGMLSSFFYDASLCVDEQGNKLHRFQKQILEKFSDDTNRFVLTAPTSFGKTFIVYQILQKMKYSTILLIFPTISLLTENYERIKAYPFFGGYSIHTLSEEEIDESANNLFIFTPERYLSFLDSQKGSVFDFAFIDEIYKIDNGYLVDEETVLENERDVAYRLALEYICRQAKDIFLAGPYISLNNDETYNSFLKFTEENNFQILQYNEFEIVSKQYYEISKRGSYNIDEYDVYIPNKQRKTLLLQIIPKISFPAENTIIYCGKKTDTEKYAQILIQEPNIVKTFSDMYKEEDELYKIFVEHLERTYGEEWIVVVALKARIGIHHGLIPKYIQKEIINLFGRGQLVCLFSTTTITEGVNTPAKNIIITSLKKGKKDLKQFDAKNIAGRAGRFGKHYSGRIIDISSGFVDIIKSDNEKLKHKNYDVNSQKSDVDYQITKDEFLSPTEQREKQRLQRKAEEIELPDTILAKFKVVGPRDKITLYESIIHLDIAERESIDNLVNSVVFSRGHKINWDGLQTVLNIIAPIVSNGKLKFMITHKFIAKSGKQYSLLVILLQAYLDNGFMGMVEYQIKNKGMNMDRAMRYVADTVYNTFKYQLVKYFGTFDILYRFVQSKERQCDMEDVKSISFLLQKLEYNATNERAKKVSDYGVPFKIIKKYEDPSVQVEYDPYEKYVDNQVKLMLNE